MGIHANGILAYGYDLGGPEDGWKIEGVDEYGAFATDWYDNEDEENDLDDFGSGAEGQLLIAAGFTETGPEAPGYYERQRAARDGIGVEITSYCSYDYPSYILAAKVIDASSGSTEPVDLNQLLDAMILQNYNEKLAAALKALNIKPTQECPQWLLASHLG